MSKEKINGIKVGDVFTVAGMEFIRFPEVNGKVPVVMKGCAFRSEFGDGTDLRESKVLKQLEKKVLPKIIEAVGEENVCTFQTDLTTWDGLKTYGVLESRISIPTMDFYRAHVEIFDKYKENSWWWLATADSAKPHYDSPFVLCVSPSGLIYSFICRFSYGVRPVLFFESSIFGSSEE